MALRATLLATLFSYASSKCVVTQDCNLGPTTPDCRPRPRTGADTPFDSFTPAPYKGPFNACPMYTDVCCSNNQMQALAISLAGVAVAFGSPAQGGCPACLANVVNFWCKYTCAPDQDTFLTTNGTSRMVDPISQQTFTVLNTAVTIDNVTACATFDSCASGAKVREFPPLQTCDGFFKYQGQTEAISNGHTFIDITFASANESKRVVSWPLSSCCNYDPDQCAAGPFPIPHLPGCLNASAHTNTSCPCATCAGRCNGGVCAGTGCGGGSCAADDFAGLADVDDSFFNGFDSLTVGAFYGAVAAAALLVAGARAACAEAARLAADPEDGSSAVRGAVESAATFAAPGGLLESLLAGET